MSHWTRIVSTSLENVLPTSHYDTLLENTYIVKVSRNGNIRVDDVLIPIYGYDIFSVVSSFSNVKCWTMLFFISLAWLQKCSYIHYYSLFNLNFLKRAGHPLYRFPFFHTSDGLEYNKLLGKVLLKSISYFLYIYSPSQMQRSLLEDKITTYKLCLLIWL